MNTNERLKALMVTRGWSANEVARFTGATVSAVYAWTSGRRPMPRHRLELLEMKVGIERREAG